MANTNAALLKWLNAKIKQVEDDVKQIEGWIVVQPMNSASYDMQLSICTGKLAILYDVRTQIEGDKVHDRAITDAAGASSGDQPITLPN